MPPLLTKAVYRLEDLWLCCPDCRQHRVLCGNADANQEAALAAITQNPPAFLESVLLELADDSRTARTVILGLKQLGTRAAKDKLAKLAGPKNPGSLKQPAIEALAELRDGA